MVHRNGKTGSWHWRCLGLRIWGIPLPVWLFPNSEAFKIIEDEKYRFYVGFSLPILGLLAAEYAEESKQHQLS